MNGDPNHSWKEQGKRFAIFQPKREKIKPSGWILGLFLMHKLLRALDVRKIFMAKRNLVRDTDEKGKQNTDEWPGFPLPTAIDSPTKLGQAPKLGKSKVIETSTLRDSFTRLSRIFRRGAFSPGLSTDV